MGEAADEALAQQSCGYTVRRGALRRRKRRTGCGRRHATERRSTSIRRGTDELYSHRHYGLGSTYFDIYIRGRDGGPHEDTHASGDRDAQSHSHAAANADRAAS
jgi:hypothetical protein